MHFAAFSYTVFVACVCNIGCPRPDRPRQPESSRGSGQAELQHWPDSKLDRAREPVSGRGSGLAKLYCSMYRSFAGVQGYHYVTYR